MEPLFTLSKGPQKDSCAAQEQVGQGEAVERIHGDVLDLAPWSTLDTGWSLASGIRMGGYGAQYVLSGLTR